MNLDLCVGGGGVGFGIREFVQITKTHLDLF